MSRPAYRSNTAELKFGDVTLRMHHFGTVHTPFDLCIEVLEDGLTLIGDVAMDRRIANMDDGSYVGTLKAYAALEKNREQNLAAGDTENPVARC